jgi:hypothetical protein
LDKFRTLFGKFRSVFTGISAGISRYLPVFFPERKKSLVKTLYWMEFKKNWQSVVSELVCELMCFTHLDFCIGIVAKADLLECLLLDIFLSIQMNMLSHVLPQFILHVQLFIYSGIICFKKLQVNRWTSKKFEPIASSVWSLVRFLNYSITRVKCICSP